MFIKKLLVFSCTTFLVNLPKYVLDQNLQRYSEKLYIYIYIFKHKVIAMQKLNKNMHKCA